MDAPPGEYQPKDFLRLVDAKGCCSGRFRIWSGGALAGGVELEPVEGTNQPTIANAASRGGAKVGPQVRAGGVGYADATAIVAPDYYVLSHPGPLNESGLQQLTPTRNVVPTLWKGV